MRPLTLAIPKGRVQKQLVPLLDRAGFDASRLLDDDRKLIRETDDGKLKFLLLKPDDVPTYVEYGAADLGIVGRDVLLERRYDLYQPLDLGIGRCRMVVAAPPGAERRPVPRVATKYPRIATDHFASKGVQAEVIFVQGSVELAPLVGAQQFQRLHILGVVFGRRSGQFGSGGGFDQSPVRGRQARTERYR